MSKNCQNIEFDNNFLNSIRNAFILLVVGLALLEFGTKLTKIGPIILMLVILLLFSALLNYWRDTNFSTCLGFTPYIIIVITGVIGWLLYESVKIKE